MTGAGLPLCRKRTRAKHSLPRRFFLRPLPKKSVNGEMVYCSDCKERGRRRRFGVERARGRTLLKKFGDNASLM